MQLVEKGLLKLDDDMRPLVPELAAMQLLKGFDENDKPILEDNTRPITLRYVSRVNSNSPVIPLA